MNEELAGDKPMDGREKMVHALERSHKKNADLQAKVERLESPFKLQWTENREPNQECPYHHAIAETPFGRFLLTWKGWKEYPDAGFDETPWGEVEYPCLDVEESKEWAQVEYNKRVQAKAESN